MISKHRAHYVDHPDAFTGHHCGTCTMFTAPASCTLVEGTIAPSGVCMYWAGTRTPGDSGQSVIDPRSKDVTSEQL